MTSTGNLRVCMKHLKQCIVSCFVDQCEKGNFRLRFAEAKSSMHAIYGKVHTASVAYFAVMHQSPLSTPYSWNTSLTERPNDGHKQRAVGLVGSLQRSQHHHHGNTARGCSSIRARTNPIITLPSAVKIKAGDWLKS